MKKLTTSLGIVWCVPFLLAGIAGDQRSSESERSRSIDPSKREHHTTCTTQDNETLG